MVVCRNWRSRELARCHKNIISQVPIHSNIEIPQSSRIQASISVVWAIQAHCHRKLAPVFCEMLYSSEWYVTARVDPWDLALCNESDTEAHVDNVWGSDDEVRGPSPSWPPVLIPRKKSEDWVAPGRLVLHLQSLL